MGKLFGVDIKGLLDKHVAPGLHPANLARKVPGARTADPTAAIPMTPVNYPCRGIWQYYAEKDIDGTLVVKGDRSAMLMLLSVPPKAEDIVTIEGTGMAIVRIIDRDPAGATYTVQCRDRTATPS